MLMNTLKRLSEIESEIPDASCVEHTELMKEIQEIIADAMNHNKQKVIDEILKILDNIQNYEHNNKRKN